jgi:segregation and condensation protein A
MVAAVIHPQLDSYQLKLPTFEGPFDVLIRLIEREQLEISEISLVAVLDQFIAYVACLETPPPAIIAEFAAVTGRLSVLKSRALLPKPVKPMEEIEEPDLVRQLEEYRAVKAAAELLAGRQKSGSGAFGRGESILVPDAPPPVFTPQPPVALANAVRRWLTRIPARPALLPQHRGVTLREMIARISAALDRGDSVSFDAIRASCANRQDVAVAFLALLTLLRRHIVEADQPEVFGSISLKCASPFPLRSDAPSPNLSLRRGHDEQHAP